MPASKVQTSSRLVVQSAIVIGLAIMGDSLMYSLLPLEAARLGIPLAAVGLLLSINRIVRLLSNTWAGLSFERFGPRKPFIFASLLAVFTSAMYGLGIGLLAFLIARAAWGIAWSIFRHAGFQAVSVGNGEERGKLMGVLWGLVRLGSAISVLGGGWLYDRYGYSAAVLAIAGASGLALPFALRMRWPKMDEPIGESQRPKRPAWKTALTHNSQSWLLAAGFTQTFFESILISTASLFIAGQFQSELAAAPISIGTLAGALLAIRFSANILFGPLIGSLSDRFGQRASISLLSGIVLLGVSLALLLPATWLPLSIAIVFIASAGLFVTMNAAASAAGNDSQRPHIYLGFFNTSIDAGAAVGPLFAYSSTLILASLEITYLVGAILLFAVMQIYVRIAKDEPDAMLA